MNVNEDIDSILDLRLVVKSYLRYCLLSYILKEMKFSNVKIFVYKNVEKEVCEKYFKLYGKKLTQQQFTRDVYTPLIKSKILFEVNISRKRRKTIGRGPSIEEVTKKTRKLVGVNPYIINELKELILRRSTKLIKILFDITFNLPEKLDICKKELANLLDTSNTEEKDIIKKLQEKINFLPAQYSTLEEIFAHMFNESIGCLDSIEYRGIEYEVKANNLLTIYLNFTVKEEKMCENVGNIKELLSKGLKILEENLVKLYSNINLDIEYVGTSKCEKLYSIVIEIIGGKKHERA